MRIYRVTPSRTEYRDIMVDDRRCKSDQEMFEMTRQMIFTGEPKGPLWRPPPLFCMYPRRPIADITLVAGNSGAFAVTPKARECLACHLELAGELLPLSMFGMELTLCNILECIDCIDQERSVWQTLGTRRILMKPHFDPSMLSESTLFKNPYEPTFVYCWERQCDPESEFKACVEANGLTGLSFDIAWSADMG